MRFLGALFFVLTIIIVLVPSTGLRAQVEGESRVEPAGPTEQSVASYPLEIVIRPRRVPRGDGYYDNTLIQTVYGQQLRLSGYHVQGVHRRIIDGRIVYDVWQSEQDLLTRSLLKEAGLLSLPSFEERLAHDLVYGSDLGTRMGGIYKNMNLLEIGYSFNFDPTPLPDGFGGKGILGERKITQDYSYDQMIFGIIDFSSDGSK